MASEGVITLKGYAHAKDLGINLNKYQIRDINLVITKGQKVFLTGEAKSGKSSILKGILGEMPLESINKHYRFVAGSVYYMNSELWIMENTLGQNILMGSEYSYSKMERALKF